MIGMRRSGKTSLLWQEVARQLECSREYCRQLVQRALRKLRKAGLESGLVDV